jgi:hypothetical protein
MTMAATIARMYEDDKSLSLTFLAAKHQGRRTRLQVSGLPSRWEFPDGSAIEIKGRASHVRYKVTEGGIQIVWRWDRGSERRVWRSDWPSDVFEIVDSLKFGEIEQICQLFSIPLRQAEE